MFKSGFVTIIGRPNVGKSTLLNRIIGEKISIVSDKPQTTRNKIQMIYTEESCQIIFLDTPGIQNPRNKLGEYMLQVSKSTLDEVDIVTFMVDDSLEIGTMDSKIIEDLRKNSTPIVLLINKIDKLDDKKVSYLIDRYESFDLFDEIIPISALNNENINKYIEVLKELLPEGPKYFPDDMITDQPERFIIAEIIREKALLNLDEEVPHGIVVEIESIKKREDKDIIDVYANIYCEKESHKAIVIGKKGSMLKTIGQSARMEIEALLGSKVNLQLWVKVERNWRDIESKVRYFGYK